MPSIEINRERGTGTYTIIPSKMKGVSCMSGKNIVVNQDEWLRSGHRIIHDILTASAMPYDGEPSEFYNEWSEADRRKFFKKNIWGVAYYKRADPRKLHLSRERGATLDFEDYLCDDFGAQVDQFFNVESGSIVRAPKKKPPPKNV